MKRLLIILLTVAVMFIIVNVLMFGESKAKLIELELGFTITANNADAEGNNSFSVEVGDKGTFFYTYENDQPNDNYLYQGDELYIDINDYHAYTNQFEILIYDNYSDQDWYSIRTNSLSGGIESLEMALRGPSDLWSGYPLIIPDLSLFTTDPYNGHLRNGGVYDPGYKMYFAVDYVKEASNPVPEPASCILLLFGLVGLVAIKKKS